MKYDFEFVRMPLAVYREVAAHVAMVDGISVELLPQTSTQFEYLQSQVGGLSIAPNGTLDSVDWSRIVQILAYYHERYPLQDAELLVTLRTSVQTNPKDSDQPADSELTATATSEVSA